MVAPHKHCPLMRNSGLFGVLVLLFLQACQPQGDGTLSGTESSSPYFPLEVGSSWTYRMDSVIYDPLGSAQPRDTSISFLREEITDTFRTPAGLTYVLERSFCYDTLLPWVYQKTIGISREPQSGRILWNEDGRIQILTLDPVFTGLTWDGTAFFDPLIVIPIYGENMQPFKSWSYQVLEKGVSRSTEEADYSDILVIQQANDENLIERRYSQTWHQRDVGLVYRHMMILDTQCGGMPADCAGIPWEDKAEKGYILHQTLIDHK